MSNKNRFSTGCNAHLQKFYGKNDIKIGARHTYFYIGFPRNGVLTPLLPRKTPSFTVAVDRVCLSCLTWRKPVEGVEHSTRHQVHHPCDSEKKNSVKKNLNFFQNSKIQRNLK